MAEEYRKELVSPSGRTVLSTSERETNDLVYGLGYREPDTTTTSTTAEPEPTAVEAMPPNGPEDTP